jgi:hypothetical protein
MKIQLLFAFFSLNTLFLLAQDLKPPRERYFFLGLGIPLATVRDEAHSPLKYQGFAPTFRLGFENINGDFVSRITASASLGTAKPKTRPKPERMLSGMEISTFQINYTYYSILNTYKKTDWNSYLGGAATLTFDLRSYNLPSNNLLGYQVNFSLNLGGFSQKQMSDRTRFSYEIFTPIVSYAMRPNYVGMIPTKGGNINPQNIFLNGRLVTIDKLFRLYNRFSLDQQIKPYRAHRLFYSWDYYNNTVSKPLKSIIGGLGYEALLKM